MTATADLLGYEGPYRGGDVELWRDEPGAGHANVPHALIVNSPTGFGWADDPAGEADLAINILLAVSGDPDWSRRYGERFRRQFLAALPIAGGTITRREIDEFLRVNRYGRAQRTITTAEGGERLILQACVNTLQASSATNTLASWLGTRCIAIDDVGNRVLVSRFMRRWYWIRNIP